MSNTVKETLEWYDNHKTTAQIGFNPDGMCLKVCRTARGLPALYPSAKIAQDSTPQQYRVTRPRDLRKGMVMYFDDPNDSNGFGHIGTMVGRVKGFDWDDFNDILVATNSVKSGELTVVRATYFKTYWGDAFIFGANWLNGQEITVAHKVNPLRQFRKTAPAYDVSILDDAIRRGGRVDLKGKVEILGNQIDNLSNDKRRSRLAAIREEFKKNRVIKMGWLNDAVKDSPEDLETKKVRDKIRQAIKSLPEN